MKLRATTTSLAVVCLLVGIALSPSRLQAQDTAPAQSQPSQQDQSSEPAPSSPKSSESSSQEGKQPAANNNTSAPAQEASPPPKPPVLKRKKHKRTSTKTPSQHQKPTTQKLPDGTSKTVVKNGGTSQESAQLSPAVAPDQAQNQRISMEELLAATNANLKKVSARPLTSQQQGTLEQIHAYLRQAKAASAAGDTNRAQTLAYKARLLSDDLAHK